MSVLSAPSQAPAASAPPLWLHSRSYDLWWYAAVPALLAIVLVSASALIGDRGPLWVYIASSMLTGLPHNMITWLLIMPKASREYYGSGTLLVPFILSAIVLAPTVALFGTPAFAWALSINTVLAYYHITRQHMGLLHSCDGRYIQATGDSGIVAIGKELRWLVAAVAAAAFVWKLSGSPLEYGLGIAPVPFMFYPLPATAGWLLTGVVAALALRLAVRLQAHLAAGKRVPASHMVLGGSAIANLIVAALVPNDQFFLTLALVASYHNLQYFAFVYTHHHLRAVADSRPQDVFTRWARDRRAWAWFALPVALGAGYGLLASATPPLVGAILLNGFMITHYFVDGNIWRRKFYPLMTRFAKGRVGEAPPDAA